jgi:hypothetical protein
MADKFISFDACPGRQTPHHETASAARERRVLGGFLDLLPKEKVQRRAEDDDGGELADLVPGRRDGSALYVGGKLEF